MENSQDAYKGPDRRSSPRLSILVTYSLVGGGVKETSVAKNISDKGICLVADKKLDIDTLVFLEINLYDDNPIIQAKGKVVWAKDKGANISSDSGEMGYEIGIEFIEITDNERQRIYQYVSSQS